MNLYQFVQSDPVNANDPLGLSALSLSLLISTGAGEYVDSMGWGAALPALKQATKLISLIFLLSFVIDKAIDAVDVAAKPRRRDGKCECICIRKDYSHP